MNLNELFFVILWILQKKTTSLTVARNEREQNVLTHAS